MPGPVDENEQDIQTGFDHYDAFGIDEIENAENYCDEIDNEDYFLSYYADFMNRLGYKKILASFNYPGHSRRIFSKC